MKDLRGFIALDERGRMGVVIKANEQDKMYYGYSIEIDDHHLATKQSALLWASRKPHVIDSLEGIRAKSRVSERAFNKRGIEL